MLRQRCSSHFEEVLMNEKHNMRTLKRFRLVIFLCFLGTICLAQGQTAEVPREEIPVEIEFSEPGGFFTENVVVKLNAPGAKIYYTLDGSTPNKKSTLYKFPLLIEETTVLRTKAYKGCLLYTSPSPRD